MSEIIVYRSSRRPSVHTFIYISKTSKPNATKFYLKHHWGGGRLHWVLVQIRSGLWLPWQQIAPIEIEWGKRRHHVLSNVFDRIRLIPAGNDDMYESLDEFEIWPDSTTE